MAIKVAAMANLGLDLEAGAGLAAQEMYGDWYRDPWGWPELTRESVAGLDLELDLSVGQADAGEYHLRLSPHFHLTEVPKSRLGVRPAVVQDPVSRLAYLSAVHAGLDSLHSGLAPWVYGWRMREPGKVARGQDEWRAFPATLPRHDHPGFGLQTDVTSFFASIRPERIEQLLTSRLGRVTATHIITDVVRAHDRLTTRSGLPQRSFASSVLAQTVLGPLDDALGAAHAGGGVTSVRRWMDDISAEGTEEALFTLLIGLHERARQVGLELNTAKTHLVSAAESAASLRLEDLKEIEVPMEMVLARYSDGDGEPTLEPNLDVLLELEATILTSPTAIPRPLARAVLLSLTRNGQFSRNAEWRAVARHLPHAADALGRYLRAVAHEDVTFAVELGAWFAEYQASVWGRLDWVASQLALAIPTQLMSRSVVDVMHAWLEGSNDLQKLAIAVQRLCAREPVIARDVIRRRVDRTSDPLILRVFALGLLQAGDTGTAAEGVLSRDRRNWLLQRHLSSKRYAPSAVVLDFDDLEDSDGR